MSQQSVLLTSSIPVEEGLAHCNEASDRFDVDGRLEQINLKADNLQPVDKTMATTNLPILDPNPTAPSPISSSPVPSVHDSASIHSLPTVQVTEPQESPPLPRSPDVPSLSDDDGVPSVQRSIGSSSSTHFPSPRRGHLSRPTAEGRSPNRISGFFSHLIHRRDPLPPSPSATAHHERTSDTPEESVLPSRASSLVPTPRPSTPPPSLPSPSLSELGLSLSVLTGHLSPSHFNSPPTSGTFLAPHYLLLCHAQGLDVLPLVSPPAPASYALIRRVSFKSVVVMEHRGVLVAISGRRDGVRVYALDEIKKAVEWRLDVEIRREREKQRRAAPSDIFSLEKMAVPRPNPERNISVRRSPSAGTAFFSKVPQPKKPAKTQPQTPPLPICPPPAINYTPSGRPPSYRSPSPPPQPVRQASATSLREARGRSTSVNDVLRGAVPRRPTEVVELDNNRSTDVKSDWMEDSHSDDEAINVVAAGASGSQALDERTSTMMPAESSASNTSGLNRVPPHSNRPLSTATLTPTGFHRAMRPPDLDLSGIRAEPRPSMPPSPTPTLITLRQALLTSPASVPVPVPTMSSRSPRLANPPVLHPDPDDDDENENAGGTPVNEPISFAEALLESRLPDLPPPGTRLPQQAILIAQSHPVATGDEDIPSAPASPGAQSNGTRQSSDTHGSRRPRRRWSVLDGIFATPGGQSEPSLSTPQPRDSQDALVRGGRPAQRSHSPFRSSPTAVAHPQSSETVVNLPPAPVLPHSRFFSRIISNAFSHRRSEDGADSLQHRVDNTDSNARKQQGLTPPHAPPPKLEYVKLPGTKGSLMIKAVETNKKSFLAILCGENGEKVELFAGTYRTALGLSRTFILPDSPRSLELQLQGDDLVEVFLVFSQNVFGLEPATVRVREVRLGRAERRAARRRARELQVDDLLGPDADAPPAVEDTTNVNVNVGFSVPSSVSVTTEVSTGTTLAGGASPSTSQPNVTQRTASGTVPKVEDIAPVPSGPYTTFQQLSFSPNFPLASVVDDYVIPPTYPSFLQYRSVYEPEVNGNADVDLSQVQFTPPGLPVPPAAPPSRWFYRDPKGYVHGPWTLSRMHAWYREALLPPDLPVRREEETEFVLLKDLRQHCVDPSQPFGPTPVRATTGESPVDSSACIGKPLLHPISLLSQPRLFGPPALFYSSRGGHSTAIVDGRGRSVLKDRFFWTSDEDVDGQLLHSGRLGDIKRLEAFDLQDRSVLVAMRQGGFEAVDLTDALLRPADASRDVLPHFTAPPFQMNRRKIFTWRIGSPASSSSSASVTVATLPRNSSRHNLSTRRPGIGPGKSSARQEFGSGDFEGEHSRSEILFLGRRDDSVYLCERDGDTFRVLRLSPLDNS
ncbi:hypothetical protein EDB92DRAFT_2052448 [Lactarius akahatsu]|uniref:GYF domain-containing protein n=1 Tax=Lactarius akahatsu TaxID=416441 RepID=A0AAD4QDW4_9AGAM|nr:hypothetical protein EDB92DRAFT_2052448 [Lactarius akahatsu]